MATKAKWSASLSKSFLLLTIFLFVVIFAMIGGYQIFPFDIIHTRQNLPLMQWLNNNVLDTRLYMHNCMSETQAPRLGNQLFFYAHLLGTALNNTNHTPLWPDTERSFIRHVFKSLSIPIDHNNAIVSSRDFHAVVIKLTSTGYSNASEHLPQSNVTFQHHVQDIRYFEHAETQLRHDFTFSHDVLKQARRFLSTSSPHKWNNNQTGDLIRIVIHVRRTDYVPKDANQSITFGFPVVKTDYFNRSMLYFESRFGFVEFVVLSDDVDWCRKNVGVGRTNVIYSAGNTPHVDLAIASLCDHAILTLGSFGWWAAWFADGTTITPRFCKSAMPTQNADLYNLDEFYKRDWIGFEQC